MTEPAENLPTVSVEEMTKSAKYIFLDVVRFTHNRNVEAQSDIVNDLNRLVLEAVENYEITDDSRIFIPTGDGLCIALLNTEGRYPYDIHLSLALRILKNLNTHNTNEPDEMRRFEVRIGINANEDNLITDINGRPNLAGAGISLASRIMDKASGSQILVGESVFERLQQRERYMGQFKPFWVTDKHGAKFRLYQYVGTHIGLDAEVPRAFHIAPKPEEPAPKLTRMIAYYLAYAISQREFISKTYKQQVERAHVLQILLYLLSKDEIGSERAAESESGLAVITTRGFREVTFENQFEYYQSFDTSLFLFIASLIGDKIMSEPANDDLFKISGGWFLFVSDQGKAKLKEQFPDIWNSWGLS